MKINKIVGLICHDAGGAELISHWAKNQDNNYITVAKGPAIRIFKSNGIKLNNEGLRNCIKKSDWVLFGTSWGSELEKEGMLICKELNKDFIVFIDHWVNYRERFVYKDNIIVPNKIWVADSYAFKIAKETLPKTTIEIVSNPYLNYVKEKVKEIESKSKKKSKKKILFIAENRSGHAKRMYGDEMYFGYTEKDALENFLERLSSFKSQDFEVIVRPHPTDEENKYDWVSGKYKLELTISKNKSLAEDISHSDIVVGCESMAMAAAVVADKETYTCIPSTGKPCDIPYDGIKDINELSPIHFN